MPVYMKVDGIKSVTLKPYTGAAALVAEVRKSHPLGVDQILIGQAAKPGYAIVKNRQGIIAILIGLLLPAVREREATGYQKVTIELSALKPTGAMGILLADGSVRHLFGSKPLMMYWELGEDG